MKKLILALTILLGFSVGANGYVIDTEVCAGDEYIYDTSGELVIYDPLIHTFVTETTPVFYAGYADISHMFLEKTRRTNIIVTNVSNRSVSFYYRPTYISESTGTIATIFPEILKGSFSSTNSPLANNGADLEPNQAGRIHLYLTSGTYYGRASIYWDSSTCGVEPILASIEHVLNSSGSVEKINNGEPF